MGFSFEHSAPSGQTLIYFTTDVPLAAQAERCYVLRDGKLTEVTL